MVYRKRTPVQNARSGEEKTCTLNSSIRAFNVFTNTTETIDASSQASAYNDVSVGAKERYDLDIWKAKALIAARNQLFK